MDHPVSLDGEWEFFPDVFLLEEPPLTLGNEGGVMLDVPSNWSSAMTDSSPIGYGSYRLRILLDPQKDNRYGIHVPNIQRAGEVYINGESLIQSGEMGRTKEAYKPANIPETGYFKVDASNEVELIIHVSNFDNIYGGGITDSITFGLTGPLNDSLLFTQNVVLIACLIYLLHAFYSVIIYLIGNRNRQFLYFAMMIVCIVIGTMFGENQLFQWFSLGYEWNIKVVMLIAIAGGFFLLQSLQHQMRAFVQEKWLDAYKIACLIAAVLVFILPASMNITLIPFYGLVMLTPCLLAPFFLFFFTFRIDQDNIFILFAIVASIWSLVWLTISLALKIETAAYPIDLIISMICLATYWFKRYFRILKETQDLTLELQESVKQKDDFLATVAHEMRNPLHSMLNMAEAVREREKDTLEQESKQALTLVNSVGQRMSRLINDLLDLAKFKENRILIEPQPVSVHGAVKTVIEMVRYMTDGKPIILRNRVPQHLPFVMADENRLAQILFNLLTNAVNYTHAGEVSVHAFEAGEWVRISVKDTGVGIDEEFLDKLFDPYEQAKNRQGASEGGFGLGLSICKHLVELHGGMLTVESGLNGGSVFTFTLEKAPQSMSQEQQNSFDQIEESPHLLKDEKA